MRHFGNPFIWLLRFRNRCGYGVHSPFAFKLITEVMYERLPYYRFAQLDADLPWLWRFRKKKVLHLFFRLTNWFQPQRTVFLGKCPLAQAYIAAACPRAVRQTEVPQCEDGQKALFFLESPDNKVIPALHSATMLVLDNLDKHHNRQWFASLPAVVRFDLYDVGIAFFDPQYHPQNYTVNF